MTDRVTRFDPILRSGAIRQINDSREFTRFGRGFPRPWVASRDRLGTRTNSSLAQTSRASRGCAVCLRMGGYNTIRSCRSRDSATPLYHSERAVEIPWVIRQLTGARFPRAMEVGQVLGGYLGKLCEYGLTVDLTSKESRAGPRWRAEARDPRSLPCERAFDAAVSISTLEHIGLGHYGDSLDLEGDRRANSSRYRALRPGGVLFATTPVYTGRQSRWQRLYRQEDLARLLSLFADVRLRF